jgi:hypothetical protein
MMVSSDMDEMLARTSIMMFFSTGIEEHIWNTGI